MDVSKISDTLKQALEIMGCDPSLIADIDHHSTIELSFGEKPSIMFSAVNGVVVLWSAVAKYDHYALLNAASQLIESLVATCDWSMTGQLQLVEDDGSFVLRVFLSENTIEQGELLADVLNQFYDSVEAFSQALK
ncbi:hypothetical protein [Citrobacter freundii]|uniref:InvB/SpaK family type III secretion system chaperone n=1 Tax=Citrobacter freundii TaxID=546 RepID=UPI000E1C4405|nr:hypothetical protein [Citrobacter freundii]RDT41394.1 hypothetical protein DXF86_10790 [Citrobacter freundii]